MHIRHIVLFLCVLVFTVPSASVAADEVFIISQQGFVQASLSYQSWISSGKTLISEFSTPLFFYYPLGKNTSLSAYTSMASAGGNSLHRLTGLGDIQSTLNYYMESLNMKFSLGLNLPTGKKAVSMEEFSTLYLLSLTMYRFRTPSFGQGLNLSPGFSWAIPAGEKWVFGLGASYQVRGSFTPFEGMSKKYDPGDEWMVTGGFDFRAGEKTIVTGDMIFSAYGKDRIGGEEKFLAGDKKAVNVQVKHRLPSGILSLLLRYRSRDKNQIAIAGGMLPEAQKTIPDEFQASGRYRFHWGNPGIPVQILAELSHFQKTAAFHSAQFFTVGITPEFQLSGGSRLPVTARLSFGQYGESMDLFGVEIGLTWIYPL
ncbi:hypothetical protein JW906_00050 [bacterium]|nr:hypothetical protein [bacterium]